MHDRWVFLTCLAACGRLGFSNEASPLPDATNEPPSQPGATAFVTCLGAASSGSVEIVRLSTADRSITKVGSFSTDAPEAIVADGENRLLHVANFQASTVSTLRILDNFELAPITTTAIGTMRNPKALRLSHSGDRLFVGNRASMQRATVLAGNVVTGELSAPEPIDSAQPSLVRDVLFVPANERLVTANFSTATLGVIALSPQGFSVLPDIPTVATPVALELSSDRKFILVAGDMIAVHPLDTDMVGPMLNPPTAAGNTPVDVWLSPDQRFAYAVNYVGNTISTMSFDAATGALALLGNDIVGTTPYAGAMTRSGEYIVVANFDSNDLVWFARDSSTGRLTRIARHTVCTNGATSVDVIDVR